MAIVSISRAAKLVRKGRQTLYNHNDKGKLSFTTDRDGKPGVDTAELVRVYGKLYMPADDVETVVQDSQGSIGQSNMGKTEGGVAVQARLSSSVPMDSDAVSTLSWFMEQVDEAKQELADTQDELAEREKSLAELREAMSSLPSPESVERRLKEQAEQLKVQHKKVLEAERGQQAKLLAEHKQQEAQRGEKWKQTIEERKQELEQARVEADQIRVREQEQASALKLEQARVVELESRGLLARILNRKPAAAG